jgi:hypothetical protein
LFLLDAETESDASNVVGGAESSGVAAFAAEDAVSLVQQNVDL